MKPIPYHTTYTTLQADTVTPVSVYLRVRDMYRDVVLLESTDFNSDTNSYSYIGINALAGIEVKQHNQICYKLPNADVVELTVNSKEDLHGYVHDFFNCFEALTECTHPATVAQQLMGYISYDSAALYQPISLPNNDDIPLMRFRFYQYVLAFNHYKEELICIENILPNIASDVAALLTTITKKNIPAYPFATISTEASNLTNEAYMHMVQQGIQHCALGNVFQVVLSRKYTQQYTGDDFNVYRALRNVNPSPYLFYFDYGDYSIMGSSPESQVIIQNNTATVHPIAGTVRRTGNATQDASLVHQLVHDAKENAEHTMLVDLARNDLSIFCNNVAVNYYKKVQAYSHLTHLVSEVQGTVTHTQSIVAQLYHTFPAGTLSGAPKHKAMQIISMLEPTARGYYGGAIGLIGRNGYCNMAIMIRSILSKHNTLTYQAGAGIVAASNTEDELAEVNHKVNALRQAISNANT